MGRLMPEVPAALAQNEVKMFCLKNKNPSKDHLEQHEEQKHSRTLSPGSTQHHQSPWGSPLAGSWPRGSGSSTISRFLGICSPHS